MDVLSFQRCLTAALAEALAEGAGALLATAATAVVEAAGPESEDAASDLPLHARTAPTTTTIAPATANESLIIQTTLHDAGADRRG